MEKYFIGGEKIELDKINHIINGKIKVEFSEKASQQILKCYQYLSERITKDNKPTYGINTGFGALYNTSIDTGDLEQLQENLVLSHACGTGAEVPHNIVRLMLLLKAVGLSYGNSGVQLVTVQRLLDFFNNNITPVVYEQGSLGASGDLAPLAHLSLPLIGKGEVYYEGVKFPAAQILQKFGWEPIRLKAKEGLALLNGTQFMSAYGVWCTLQSQKLSRWADVLGALSLEAFDGRIEPFHPFIHQVRPHNGQIATAEAIRKLLEGSELIQQAKKHVQDPYSFRCIPQVHGASKDALNYVLGVMTTEANSATDNPTIFYEADLIISAGNFHGQPLALALDFLAIAVAELASISERRTYQLISGQRGLPPFLVAKPGLNSGLMIPQYAAAGIVSQNKQLCTPASVDSIVSSNGQEDHVSMGANAATKAYRVVKNLQTVLGIELLNAAQALEFRRPLKTSPILEKLVSDYRKEVAFIEQDRYMHEAIQQSITFIERTDY